MNDNFAIFRVEKVKSCSSMTHRQIHNSRARGFLPQDRAEDRSNIKTVTVHGTPMRDVIDRNLTYADFFNEKLNEYGINKVRKNAVIGFEVVLTMSDSSHLSLDDTKNWVAESMKWICQNFGAENVYSARVHIGGENGLETTTHLHILLSPFIYDKEREKHRLSANSIISTPKQLSEMQDTCAKAMERFGLDRGIKRLDKQQHKSARQFWKEEHKNTRELEAYKKMFGTPLDWSFEQAAEFKMTSRPELQNEKSDKPIISIIEIERG